MWIWCSIFSRSLLLSRFAGGRLKRRRRCREPVEKKRRGGVSAAVREHERRDDKEKEERVSESVQLESVPTSTNPHGGKRQYHADTYD
jgi:hypothetical protein